MTATNLLGAIAGEQENAYVGEAATDDAQQVEGGGVCPVQVVDEEDHRLDCRQCRQVVPYPPEDGLLTDQGLTGTIGGQYGCWQGGQRVAGGSTDQRLDPRTVGRRLREVVAPADEDERTKLRRLVTERLSERGLADPRLADDEHEAALPAERGAEMRAQDTEFTVASDQRGWSIRRCGGAHGLPRVVFAARRTHSGQRTVAK